MEKDEKPEKITKVPWHHYFQPDVESRYREYFYSTNMGFIRLSFIASTITTFVFNIFTSSLVYHDATNPGLIKLVSFSLVLLPLIGLLLSYLPFYKKIYHLQLNLLFCITNGCVLTIINLLSNDHKISSYGAILFLLLINYGLLRQRILSAAINGAIATIMFLVFAQDTGLFSSNLLLQILSYFFLFNFGGAAITYVFERSQRTAFLAKEEIEAEHDRAENLLLNILPIPIARRLKDSREHIADQIDEVSVLFADIVGFSAQTKLLKPQDLVGMLDSIFTDFDAIMENHGIEKIKTIGDNYMAAAGLLDSSKNHCNRLAMAAVELMALIKSHPSGINLRIGLHMGPVIAGVIGRKKMIYDLWGDTVNIASRMESHGHSGQIQVSETVYHRLKNEFELSNLSSIEVKGQGQMKVAQLLGAKIIKKAS